MTNYEAESLFSRILSHRAKAMDEPDKGHYHAIAEHNGLTIHFHDSLCSEPGCLDCPPLAVTVYSDAEGDVFMGNVDPDDTSFNFVAEWKRGGWEALLLDRVLH